MWLLNVHTRRLESFEGEDIPPYAILSHRWETDELNFCDIGNGTAFSKKGYRKVDFCCKQAFVDHRLHYAWVDTCCIDKSNSSELSEAINSMYKWYANAKICYAYLSDVNGQSKTEIEESAWFTRGWTLQELLAPDQLHFYSRKWCLLGSKEELSKTISKTTGIPQQALKHFDAASGLYSVADRMSWASMRHTSRQEDLAYCLLGLFGVNMPMIYGEGNRAFLRLQEEILKTSGDLSIFAWQRDENLHIGVLAASPASFTHRGKSFTFRPWMLSRLQNRACSEYPTANSSQELQGVTMSSAGIAVELYLIPHSFETYLASVCQSRYEDWVSYAESRHSTLEPMMSQAEWDIGGLEEYTSETMMIQRDWETGYFRRVAIDGRYLFDASEVSERDSGRSQKVIFSRDCVEHYSSDAALQKAVYGFTICHVAAHFSTFIRSRPSEWATSSSDDGFIELVSRTPFSHGPRCLLLRSGSIGVVGKVCFFDTAGPGSVHLYFGFDFDFNPFCLAVLPQVSRQNTSRHNGQDLMVRNDSLRNVPYLLTSSEDMMDLVTVLGQEKNKHMELEHDRVQLCLGSWRIFSWSFSIGHATLTLERYSSARGALSVYHVDICSGLHKAIGERTVKDQWYVSPWPNEETEGYPTP